MKTLLYLAGFCQLLILIASALVPRTLDWRNNLAGLHPFLRKLFWVYGSFIVLTVVGFAVLTFINAGTMASGNTMARSICALIALFWAARLFVQWAIFDARPFLTTWYYRVGYQALTLAFLFLVIVYSTGAIAPSWPTSFAWRLIQ